MKRRYIRIVIAGIIFLLALLLTQSVVLRRKLHLLEEEKL